MPRSIQNGKMPDFYMPSSERSMKHDIIAKKLRVIKPQTIVPLPPCAHVRNENEYIGVCGQCGGPTPYCTKCDKPFCEWCE